MANDRLSLQLLLEKLIGNRNVYYRPPENLKMNYPCIRYNRDEVVSEHADNISYRKTNRYQLIVIDRNHDNPVIDKLLDLPMCKFNTHYESDNLNHDVFTLYY